MKKWSGRTVFTRTIFSVTGQTAFFPLLLGRTFFRRKKEKKAVWPRETKAAAGGGRETGNLFGVA